MTRGSVVRPAGSHGLAEALAAAVAKLGRFGASYPIYLEPPPGQELYPAAELFEAGKLERFCQRAIGEWTDHPREEDARAAASRFMRRYCGSLAMATLVPLAHGVAFDLSIERISLLIRTEMPMGVVLSLGDALPYGSPDRPARLPIETRQLPAAAALREAALQSLVADNLSPAFDAILKYVHLNPKVLWATVAEQIDQLFDYAADLLGPDDLAPFAEDRDGILFGPTLPGIAGPNPLAGTLSWELADDPLFPRPLQVRQICCVNYVVPGRNAYCRTCVLLTAEQRLSLWKSFRASIEPPTDASSAGPANPPSAPTACEQGYQCAAPMEGARLGAPEPGGKGIP